MLPTLGLIWLWASIKAKQHREALEAQEGEDPGPEEDPEIPNQQSDTNRKA